MNAARVRSAGFTLVEVLIALTVVAIGLGAAVAVVNQSVYNAYSLQQKTLASWVAENKLAEIRAAAAVPDFDEADGDSELGGRFWRWNAEVLETGVENVTRIEIGVASEENSRQGINAWKRRRLIEAGAHVIVGDYRCQDELLRRIGLV